MYEFEYFYTQQINGVLQIENIGECCIEACTDLHECYYLIIRTAQGVTRIFQYGPIVPGVGLLEKSCKCSFKRIDFDERKINKTIDAFLNNPYANITQAQEISIENALNNCIDMIEYIKDKDKF